MKPVEPRDAVIVSAVRSPIGRAGKGSLREMRADDLAAQMVTAAIDAVPGLDPGEIDDLLLGCGLPGGEAGFNMGRVVGVLSGLKEVPGATVTRYCASSVQTTRMAMHAIRAGEGHVFISAGVECVSRFTKGSSDSIPGTENPRFESAGSRTRRVAEETETWLSSLTVDELPDVYIPMGQTAENVAELRGVTREDQDEFALRSQGLAQASVENGFWAREITPVRLPDGSFCAQDDSPRPNTTIEALSALSPAFRQNGSVTAGNACPLNDGAAALILMSGERAMATGSRPLVRVLSTGVSGLDPEIMGLGPVEASRRALTLAGLSMKDIDLIEINEAFAAQVIPSAHDLEVPLERLNVNGGAIAVGHPFGMTGARLTTTLINSLQFHDKQFGLLTMCVGGGQGMAMILERLA